MATIESIEQGAFEIQSGFWVDDFTDDGIVYSDRPRMYPWEGVTITLSDGNVWQFGISAERKCCEDWGFIECPDDPATIIGHEFIKITPINTDDWVETGKTDNTAFVNVCTDRDTLQFVVYNDHNGYYGHDVSIFLNGTTQSTARI